MAVPESASRLIIFQNERRAPDVLLGAIAPMQHEGGRAAMVGRPRDRDARARDHAGDVTREFTLDIVAIE